MRDTVAELIAPCRLPAEVEGDVPRLQAFEAAIKLIDPPVSDAEALALLSVFPASAASCFGLAWSVLHLIETAPGWPIPEAKSQESNPWVQIMLQRAS